MQDATVTLGGLEWQIRFVRRNHSSMRGKKWGLCDWTNRIIYVRKDLSRRNVLDTLIHEMRHSQHEVIFEAESYVNWTSTELADGLLATGIIKE